MISRIALSALAAVLLAGGRPVLPDEPAVPTVRWYKGNLHTHSLWSDGDEYPEGITAWYRDRGYHFLASSDHNTLAEARGRGGGGLDAAGGRALALNLTALHGAA